MEKIIQHPILFSTPMVQAILAGRKTQTRRIIKSKHESGMFSVATAQYEPNVISYYHNRCVTSIDWDERTVDGGDILCPYGEVGDILWVRESFRVNTWVPDDGEVSFRYEADGSVSPSICFDDDYSEIFNNYWIQSCDDLLKAGYKPNQEERFEDYDYKALRLRPNIFLRKVAARIWLQITDIRIERLQDISEEDAKAEGILYYEEGNLGVRYKDYMADASGYGHPDHDYPTTGDAVASFGTLWAGINGLDSWQANPWVWVITFKRIDNPAQ